MPKNSAAVQNQDRDQKPRHRPARHLQGHQEPRLFDHAGVLVRRRQRGLLCVRLGLKGREKVAEGLRVGQRRFDRKRLGIDVPAAPERRPNSILMRRRYYPTFLEGGDDPSGRSRPDCTDSNSEPLRGSGWAQRPGPDSAFVRICTIGPCLRRGRQESTLTGHSFDDANGPARQESRSLMARQKA